MSSGASESDRQQLQSEAALKQTVELLKFTITLATGSLVFSAGLLAEDIHLNCVARYILIVSWAVLAISAASGVLAFMRVPVLIAQEDFNIRDRFMEIPGRIHHIAFVVGIVCLGVTLVIALVTN